MVDSEWCNQSPYTEQHTTEPVNIGGFSIDTGLEWYWGATIIMSVILLVYAGNKGIDYWFLKKSRRNAAEHSDSEDPTEPKEGFDGGYTTVFMSKSENDSEVQKIMKKRKK